MDTGIKKINIHETGIKKRGSKDQGLVTDKSPVPV
jgi:hypothetical protein